MGVCSISVLGCAEIVGGGVAQFDWDDFRLFAAVARNGNFTRAARELRITEPTISRRIKRLEDAVGVKLFTHAGGDAHLTHDGRRVLNHTTTAEYAITQAARATNAAHENSVCKILCGDGLSAYWLPQFLPPFMERHPHIDLALFTTADRYGPKPPLFDLRIQYTEAASVDLVCVRLGTMHFTLFASPRYIRAHGKPTQLSELAHHRVLDLALDMSEKGNLATWAKLAGRNALLTNLNGALGETVRHGGGIALLPTFAALFDSAFVPVLPAFSLPISLFLCFEREDGKRPAVRTTIDYLKDVVFDRKSMPWFAESYERPEPSWARIYKSALSAYCPVQDRSKKGRPKPGRAGG
jgi:molybdate transport repressor ModE-like protein